MHVVTENPISLEAYFDRCAALIAAQMGAINDGRAALLPHEQAEVSGAVERIGGGGALTAAERQTHICTKAYAAARILIAGDTLHDRGHGQIDRQSLLKLGVIVEAHKPDAAHVLVRVEPVRVTRERLTATLANVPGIDLNPGCQCGAMGDGGEQHIGLMAGAVEGIEASVAQTMLAVAALNTGKAPADLRQTDLAAAQRFVEEAIRSGRYDPRIELPGGLCIWPQIGIEGWRKHPAPDAPDAPEGWHWRPVLHVVHYWIGPDRPMLVRRGLLPGADQPAPREHWRECVDERVGAQEHTTRTITPLENPPHFFKYDALAGLTPGTTFEHRAVFFGVCDSASPRDRQLSVALGRSGVESADQQVYTGGGLRILTNLSALGEPGSEARRRFWNGLFGLWEYVAQNTLEATRAAPDAPPYVHVAGQRIRLPSITTAQPLLPWVLTSETYQRIAAELVAPDPVRARLRIMTI